MPQRRITLGTILEYGHVLVFALSPLLINLKAEEVYEPIKIYTIASATIVATTATIVWYFKKRLFLPELCALDIGVVLYLISLATSTIFSVDPALSFWGSPLRMTGLWWYAVLFLTYGLARFHYSARLWNTFMVATTAAIGLVSIYGILQWLRIDFSIFANGFPLYREHDTYRAFATLGHPNFLGAYLVLALPLIVSFLFTKKPQKIIRVLMLTITLLAIIATALTYSRGAWIALVISMVVYGLVRAQDIKWKTITAIIPVALIFLILVLTPSSKVSFLNRLQSLGNLHEGSSQIRLQEWKTALMVIPTRPFTGFGLETYYLFSNGELPINKKLPLKQFVDPTILDRLHNLELDTLWAGGIVSLLALIAVMVLAFRKLFFLLKNESTRENAATLIASLVAYLTVNQFSFDFSISSLWFFLILGVTATLAHARSPHAPS